jgi:hypothetical protein
MVSASSGQLDVSGASTKRRNGSDSALPARVTKAHDGNPVTADLDEGVPPGVRGGRRQHKPGDFQRHDGIRFRTAPVQRW